MKYRISTSNERVWCTTQLAKVEFQPFNRSYSQLRVVISSGGQQLLIAPSNSERHGHPAAWRVKAARSSPHHVEPKHSSTRSQVLLVDLLDRSPEKRKRKLQHKERKTNDDDNGKQQRPFLLPPNGWTWRKGGKTPPHKGIQRRQTKNKVTTTTAAPTTTTTTSRGRKQGKPNETQ